MTAEQFTTWLRGYMAAMQGRLGTPADVETIRAELAKVAAPPVLKSCPPLGPFDDIVGSLKRAADEAEKRKGAELLIWPQNPAPTWVGGCHICGAGAGGVSMGVVCSNPHCPTRITCGTATAYVGPNTGLMGTVQGSSIK